MHVTVAGRVQGVFFRDGCREEARRRDVSGWVRNNSDGTVEAVFEGEAAAVQAMVDWMRVGPPHARVESISAQPEEPDGVRDFQVL